MDDLEQRQQGGPRARRKLVVALGIGVVGAVALVAAWATGAGQTSGSQPSTAATSAAPAVAQAAASSPAPGPATSIAPATAAGQPASAAPGVSSSPAPGSNSSATPGSAPVVNSAGAVKAVVEKAAAEQQSATAQNNPAIMRDTATSSYYADLAKTQQAMLSAGVSSINLVSFRWGQVSVSGATAQAITTETWQVNFADGTSQQSTDRNAYSLVQQAGVWLIASDAQVGSGAVSQQGGTSLSQSTNWSGYAATGGSFTSVTGTWTVPQVSVAGGSGGADAAWVGIGGVTSSDLIQAGTDASVSATGQVTYEAWVETLPAASTPVALQVRPGDQVTVTLSEKSASTWSVRIANDTTGATYQTTVHYASSLSSAEWIEEAPSTASGRSHFITLDQFGKVPFKNATAVMNGKQVTVAQAGAQSIAMHNQSGTIATTSALGADGSSFTVTRVNGVA